MRSLPFPAVLIAAALLLPAAARAADPPWPERKPGLWIQTLGMAGRPVEVRSCIDAQTDRKMWDQGLRMGNQDCSRHDVTKTATGLTLDMVCRMGDRTMTGHGVITATDNTAFHADMQSRIDPPMQGMPAETRVSMDGRWSGPCPADMRPGDMILPGGVKMNVNRAPG